MNWKSYIAVVTILLVLDAIWLNVSKNMYDGLVRAVQCGKGIRVQYVPAILCYIVLIVGILMFSVPLASEYAKNHGKVLAALLYGGVFGLIVYGVFNLTNLAIFENYKWTVAIVDTLWGFTVSAIATYAGIYFE